jgi:hypothetical protein
MNYKFSKFVGSKDILLNRDTQFILEHLTVEEMQELIELSLNPMNWAKSGLRQLGRFGRGIANIPNQVRAGYHDIDTTANPVGTPGFNQQLAMKQYGLDPNQFTNKNGQIDQAKLDKAVAAAKFNALPHDQQMSTLQQQQQTAQQQGQVIRAQGDLNKMRNPPKPAPTRPPAPSGPMIDQAAAQKFVDELGQSGGTAFNKNAMATLVTALQKLGFNVNSPGSQQQTP